MKLLELTQGKVEVFPEDLLKEISKRTTLLTSSIGAGSGGDMQFLFAEDILGNNPLPIQGTPNNIVNCINLSSKCRSCV
ncbi:MAG: hypothetical protein CM1200mP4_0890 [Rhodospirillaceae bacterium]|nr:MAG: hypothetical protein CM1200mP4_0890 [Rhodospirillaceae bacterium]